MSLKILKSSSKKFTSVTLQVFLIQKRPLVKNKNALKKILSSHFFEADGTLLFKCCVENSHTPSSSIKLSPLTFSITFLRSHNHLHVFFFYLLRFFCIIDSKKTSSFSPFFFFSFSPCCCFRLHLLGAVLAIFICIIFYTDTCFHIPLFVLCVCVLFVKLNINNIEA